MQPRSVALGVLSLAALGVMVWGPTPQAAPARATQTPKASAASTAEATGVREAAWSPDGKRLAVSYYDELWTMAPDGKQAKKLIPKAGSWISQRDPAWSPDGKSIAFAAESGGQ